MKWSSLRDVSQKTAASSIRFPLTFLSAFIGFGLAVWAIHSPSATNEILAQYMPIASLGISLFIAAQFLAETHGQNARAKITLYAVALAALAGFAVTYTSGTEIYGYRAAQLLLAFHLSVALSSTPRSFWRFNAHIFTRICTAILYSGTLYVGLCFALWAIDKLLGVKIDHKVYAYLGVFMSFIYNTWFFLIGFPERLSDLEQDYEYPHALRIFAQYILMPLTIIYLIIFYLYVGKICAQWKWPEGRIGYLVCGAAFVGIFTHLLLDPLREDERYPAVGIYVRWFYRVLFPLSILLAMATSRRVSEYGLTEKRYFLYVIAFWTAGLSIYYGWMNRRNLKAIPFSLFLLAIVTIGGPWSAYSVSRWNQTQRLETELEKIGALSNGTAQKVTSEVSYEDRQKISRTLDYLLSMHGGRSVKKLFGDVGTRPSASDVMLNKLGLSYVARSYREDQPEDLENIYLSAQSGDALNIGGYEGLYEFSFWQGEKYPRIFQFGGTQYALGYSSATSSIQFKKGEDLLIDVPVNETIDRAVQYVKSNKLQSYAQLPREQLSLSNENERIGVKILITNANVKISDKLSRLENISGNFLFKFRTATSAKPAGSPGHRASGSKKRPS